MEGKFQLHELVEIVRQSSDLDFAKLLNRVREDQHANDDLTQVIALANTNTATWFDEFVEVYLNNDLADKENDSSIRKLDSEIVVFKAQDSKKDTETNTCFIAIPDNFSLSQSSNLPAELKLCVGARIMLTDILNVFDRLINGSIETVKHLDIRLNSLCSAIYVKFDDPKDGNYERQKTSE